MTQKNKPNVAGARLREFIAEALKLRESQQKVFPVGVVPPAWPAWPFLDGVNVFGSKVAKELGPPDKSAKLVKWRLTQFVYPYPEGNKKGKTFYQHVQSLGLLDLLLNPPLLSAIRRVWWFEHHYREETTARKGKKSEHGYDFAFHRQLMFECSAHLHRIGQLVKKHRVKEGWIEEYRPAILKQLLHEAVIYYPELLSPRPKPAFQIHPHSLAVDGRVDLYDALEAAFAKKKIKGRKIVNQKLAQQLTALFCSNSEQIRKRMLHPFPKTVRRNVRDRKRNP